MANDKDSIGIPVKDENPEYTKLLNEVITLRWKCGDQAAELADLRAALPSIGDYLTEEDLLEVLRSETGWHNGKKVTGKCLASKYGVSEQYMNNVLSQRRGIGEKLSDAMGFHMVVTFERKHQ